MNKFTKIVATISDLKCDIPFLKSLVDEGVNVIRLNSAHMSKEGFDKVINNIRSVSRSVAVLMDTKGPEIRTTTCDEPLLLTTGMHIDLVANPEIKTTLEQISVNYTGFVHDVPVGASILFDDGEIELVVLANEGDRLKCGVLNDGVLGARKSVNVPGVKINLPSLTERDRATIQYCIENDVEFIAHSFVRNRGDVLAIQEILDQHNSPIKIIAKIENQEGVSNIDEIIDVAYGIMVARGDLGIEIPLEKIPAIQSMIIEKCVLQKTPVIVATQMLHSMISSPRPTRAEVSDVANAIVLRTDAVMLSGETAYGKYPVEAVRTMRRIISEAETHRVYRARIKPDNTRMDVTAFLANQAVKSVEKLGVKAIITDSYSGRTARNLSAYRGSAPIYAICYNERVTRELALSYGIWTVYQERGSSKRGYYIKALKSLMNDKHIEKDDMVAYIGGSLHDKLGTTMLELNRVKDAIDFFENKEQ